MALSPRSQFQIFSLPGAQQMKAPPSSRCAPLSQLQRRPIAQRPVTAATATSLSLVTQNLIDSVLGSGVKSGYDFTTGAAPAASTTDFVIAAAPVTSSGVYSTGTREFCIDQSGVLTA